MKYDIFLSISQTEADGYTPSSKEMFHNFFDQVVLADSLNFETAWVAETHLSCQTQKKTSLAVVPEFKGEIGLNTDIMQLAPAVFSRTQNINVGSAIRNIMCNGGPIAHAEAVKTFMALHQHSSHADRLLELGFAAGRFDFSNAPFGVHPRKEWEKSFWHVAKSRALEEAVEIFMRLLRGEEISSSSTAQQYLTEKSFRSSEDWNKAVELSKKSGDFTDGKIKMQKFFDFEVLSLIPLEADMSKLQLTVGTHDPQIQIFCNKYFPTRVFNLSITSPKVIEETHLRMSEAYHSSGGAWKRSYMPRTAMIFIDDKEGASVEQKNQNAKEKAHKAWVNYWKAMSGTIDEEKVKQAVDNTIFGCPEEVAEKISSKYHPEDRLMLWFDFNNHDNEDVKKSMRLFRERVIPLVEAYGKN